MTQSEFIQSVRQSIANGETEEALDILQENISDFDESLLSDITLLEAVSKMHNLIVS